MYICIYMCVYMYMYVYMCKCICICISIYLSSVIYLYQTTSYIWTPNFPSKNLKTKIFRPKNLLQSLLWLELKAFLFHILWMLKEEETYVWWKGAILDPESSPIQCKIHVPITFISKIQKHSELQITSTRVLGLGFANTHITLPAHI